MKQHYIEYFNQFKEIGADGTEHSYRTAFENLLNQIKPENIRIIHEPKRQKGFGAPDFRIEKDRVIIGYIECKKPDDNLEKILKSGQIVKYLNISDNFILTNYHEIILIKSKEPVGRSHLFYLTDIEKKKTSELQENYVSETDRLFSKFFMSAPKQISDSHILAVHLAERAKILREYVSEILNNKETYDFALKIQGLFATFGETLVRGLEKDEFADAYAQTVIYGLFLARMQSEKQISLNDSDRLIPVSFRVIREFFTFISHDHSLPNHIVWIFNEIIALINNIDLKGMSLSLSFEQKDTEQISDPYLYFYETFLGEFDPAKRKAKGVYYTPPQVVNFITRSVDSILTEQFFKPTGFADPSVTVLDFATGTGTFLLAIFEMILNRIRKNDAGSLKSVIKNHILENFYGFECLVAPYTVAHLKLSQLLKDNGHLIENDERLRVYLTDTLDDSQHKANLLFPVLSKEGSESNAIKLDKAVLVVIGNPPYYSKSGSGSKWVEAYKPEKETNIQPLHDDYIKFIRFAHDKIDKNKQGVIGIITNNSFLSGLIHRKMRHELIKSFDEIYILNLHGNARIGEISPNRSPDENVFDIMVGVSIGIFVKKEKRDKTCKVFYHDLYGRREEKFDFLIKNTLKSVNWKILTIEKFDKDFKKTKWGKERFKEGLNFFVPVKDGKTLKDYGQFWGVYEIFEQYSSGVKTHRDHFLVGFDKETLAAHFDKFNKNDIHFAKEVLKLKDTRDWKLAKAKEKLKNTDISDYIKDYSYRPFDTRKIIYHLDLIDRGTSRHAMAKNFLEHDNTGLAFARQTVSEQWQHSLVTDDMADGGFISSKTSEWTYIAPLYLYQFAMVSDKTVDIHFVGHQTYTTPLYLYSDASAANSDKQNGIFTSEEKGLIKKANFTKQFKDFIKTKYSHNIPTPEQIFAYIYAALYSPQYREKYLEFLKIDFPRIPFCDDIDKFKALSELGAELIEHHLMKKAYPENAVSFPEQGTDIAEKIRFVQEPTMKTGKVFINYNQYFGNVSANAWEFHVGGYQVLDKWLKSRKDRILNYQDKEDFKKIVNILTFTYDCMNRIDEVWQS